MRILSLLFFAMLAAPVAQAQPHLYDLTDMPTDFYFESPGTRGLTKMRFIGMEHGAYLFESLLEKPDGTRTITLVRVNNQSQTLSIQNDQGATVFAPHDCGPSLGACAYSVMQDGNLYLLKKQTFIVDGVMVSDTMIQANGAWVPFRRTCSTYDTFGFWIDSINIRNGQEESASTRSLPALTPAPETRLKRLRRICAGGAMTS
ncbi:MAG: hypothetical protein L3J33_04535 [Rhodobacteraceae bacterium]|nr:hypothetical protein [Paracoccaceae bacterium]